MPRLFRALALAGLSLLFSPGAALAESDNFLGHREPIDPAESRVIMLGTTGGPIPRVDRSQPASLVVARGKAFLVDAGAGAARQLVTAGYALNQVEAVFLTHLHLDHTAGLAPFMAFDWISGRKKPVPVYGPPGTDVLVKQSVAVSEISQNLFRTQMPFLPEIGSLFPSRAVDVGSAAKIYDDGEIRVFAIENSHYSTMPETGGDYGRDKSYSYRFELPDRTIVFTGDTGPSPVLTEFAKGADILVSEIIDTPTVVKAMHENLGGGGVEIDEQVAHMEHEHLSAQEVGRLAAAAKVKMVVLSHLVGAVRMNPDPLVRGVRKHFEGPVVAAQDLDAF